MKTLKLDHYIRLGLLAITLISYIGIISFGLVS